MVSRLERNVIARRRICPCRRICRHLSRRTCLSSAESSGLYFGGHYDNRECHHQRNSASLSIIRLKKKRRLLAATHKRSEKRDDPKTGEARESPPLDEIDFRILQYLQQDARITNVELADRVGLSPAPCLRRVQALEKTHVIRQYVTLLDPKTVDLAVTVFVQISLDHQMEGRLEIFERAILDRPEVLECYLMTGDADYLLRVVVPDVAAYERFLKETLTRIESAAGIKSSFALNQVKYSTALPLPTTVRTPSTSRFMPQPKEANSTTQRRRRRGRREIR
jgi:Lrp/AsnC family leucine-responsive transcriptional regulator